MLLQPSICPTPDYSRSVRTVYCLATDRVAIDVCGWVVYWWQRADAGVYIPTLMKEIAQQVRHYYITMHYSDCHALWVPTPHLMIMR